MQVPCKFHPLFQPGLPDQKLMQKLLAQDALRYFFGPHFEIDVALRAISQYRSTDALVAELNESVEAGTPHTGIQLVGHHNVDTGASVFVLMQQPGELSGVSFFMESNHRLFGGGTMLCVPLLFCSPIYTPTGEHLVYRHTYKKPRFTEEEIEKISHDGTDQEKIKAFVFSKSRIGYETIPGMRVHPRFHGHLREGRSGP